MSRRRVLKERKRPFNLQEDLTINRREILKYLNKDIEEGIVSKVWTVDGVICFRPLWCQLSHRALYFFRGLSGDHS